MFKSTSYRSPKKNKFDLSYERKMSMQMGGLYPCYQEDIVPGDSFRVNSEVLLRLAPLLSPVMHRVNVNVHYFFVPYRLLWSEWEDFITGGEDGTANPPYPRIALSDQIDSEFFSEGSLADYLGLPTIPDGEEIQNTDNGISALPFRAYQLIYNEYYRDQNLIDKVPITKNSGDITTPAEQDATLRIRTRAWEKDYFTSSLPESQRGGEAEIPIGTISPNYKSQTELTLGDGSTPLDGNLESVNGALSTLGTPPQTLNVENLDDFDVDPVSINELRKANRLQQWLERSMRGGSRYIEQILSHFGVRSSDQRLQRPEYLGGGRQPVVISEVLQTSSTDATTPQGEMAGHGISVGNANSFQKTFEEHGIVLGIISVLPKTTYQQGIHRMWTKFDKFDYYFPEFAHLGEQEVKGREIFTDYQNQANWEDTFGYQERYAEYKHRNNEVAGDFRSSLAFWHMGRIFTSAPSLNENFVTSDPTKRIFAVTEQTVDNLYVQIYHNVSALRPMPYHSIPQL